jgi:hypothetical protein
MNKVFCPHCGSLNLEYTESLDLLQCLNCSLVIWDEDILNQYKYPAITKLSQIKINQLSEYPHDQ